MPDAGSFDEFVSLVSQAYSGIAHWYFNVPANQAGGFISANNSVQVRSMGTTGPLPSLPTGVSKYRAVASTFSPVFQDDVVLCKAINMGTLDISTNAFTDGSAYPTRTELGVAGAQTWGPILAEVTTTLNATPGSLTVNYTDQDGNAGTFGALAMTASTSAGQGAILGLNAGDYGARDVTGASRTLGTTPTGTIKFWGLIPLAMMPAPVAAGTSFTAYSFLTSSFNLLELGAGDEIKVLQLSAVTTNTSEYGELRFVGELT